ncbi:uncharacterized protein HD556DRAFT_1451551 [Suillus plorans]|uniref:C2H2-type domain-containing protein n=1 Tax=Suillus plorans TaxID=116603 RepID=A0A9P7A9M9_9AGAM|nr:uncharacterized protein HD556DRAFT_1451551 [Suillus plorans]KAG1784663.1 hypothetical protein HD556DRAFT_1451551 [Suillus plorans]
MNDYFKCHEKCGRSFSAPGGLTRHRQSCSYWQQQLIQQSLHFKRASEIRQGASAAKKIKLSTAQTTSEDATMSDVPSQVASTPGITSAASSSSYTLPGPSFTGDSELRPREHSLLEEQPQAEPSMEIPTPEGIRPTRSRRLPMRFRDEPPVPPPLVPQSPPSTLPRVILHVFDSFWTSLNQFGIGRDYHHRPTHDPDVFVSSDQLSNFYSNASFNPELPSNSEATSSSKAPPWPWRNMSVWRLMSWMLTGVETTILRGANKAPGCICKCCEVARCLVCYT